jgi:hypothetical protein
MNYDTMKKLLKRYGFDDSDPLLEWINVGINSVETYHDWPFLQSMQDLQIVAGTADLVVPADFSRVMTLRDMSSDLKLQHHELAWWEQNITQPTTTGEPTDFVVWGGKNITVWPVPDTTTMLRLFYVRQIDEMDGGGTDVPDLPRALHYAVVQFAGAFALQMENEEDRAANAQAQAEAMCNRVWGKYSTSVSGESRRVVDTAGYC